ncbi:MAG: 3-methyl-2-oxobutanoate hydroxymethyltransferase [Nitrospirae bacterium]|nr:MAG: 3-methyl-2-oxobutanoate hydroxymethyltransferase [Nitrospirota bacterium]
MTVPEFAQYKQQGKKIAVVTAYDALFAKIIEQAGIEAILVGDSVGMVVQGNPTTLTVTMEEMLYHTRMVARATHQACVIADLPFLSYQVSVSETVRNAGRLLQAGATAVKLEGGDPVVDRVAVLTRMGIPVMGHLGMTPQSVHRYGGYKVQGKSQTQADELLAEAKALEAAGAFALVLEAVPAQLARSITQALTIPTIGIGAGPSCDGQVLVLYDLLGLFDEFVPKYVKPYARLKAEAIQALRQYKEDVERQKFPAESESYHA